MAQYHVTGTAMPMPNGTILTNENVEMRWNVSFNFSKIDSI
jgi:hypothetical protein